MNNWNGWQLRGTALAYPAYGRSDYDIDLRDCTSSAEVLDIIMQIAGKTWADDPCLAGLVRAINDILHPQAHLCSMGQSRTMRVAEIRKLCQRVEQAEQTKT